MNDAILKRPMRDVFIEHLYRQMKINEKIFFLSADFGSSALDKIREDFPDRFINVGIAEQNLINVATGLALEDFIVYAYAISSFLTMRAYEQIRVNLSLLSQLKGININLIGVGAGLSYDVSGPTHHCFEDITIMRLLPHLIFFSPSDWILAKKFLDYSIRLKKAKYLRFDGKPLAPIYKESEKINFKDGFCNLINGETICLVSTGYMTHVALQVAKALLQENLKVGVIDLFMLKPFNDDLLYAALKRYKIIITMEEAFINRGGLDSIVANLLNKNNTTINLRKIGFNEQYIFISGSRDFLHKYSGFGITDIVKSIKSMI